MDYSLAKELKDAGFPQEGDYWMTLSGVRQWRPFPELRVYVIPTLEELIERCEYTHTFDLSYRDHSKKWRAFMNGTPNGEAFGATPLEAVAKLWLAINTTN